MNTKFRGGHFGGTKHVTEFKCRAYCVMEHTKKTQDWFILYDLRPDRIGV